MGLLALRRVTQGFSLAMVLLLASCERTPSGEADGARLPPDPGEEGKRTLAGIDVDNDGVRDDVQRYIYNRHPDDPVLRQILLDQARLLQSTIIDSHDIASRRALSAQKLQNIYCLMEWRPEDGTEELRLLLHAAYNTYQRFEAEGRFEESLPGSTYVIDAALLDGCSSEVTGASTRAVASSSSVEVLMFINGVQNTEQKAMENAIALSRRTGRNVILFHNPTNGWFDFVEVAGQLHEERAENWREWLLGSPDENALKHYALLMASFVSTSAREDVLVRLREAYESHEGKNVVLVAHSQGNLYANALYDRLLSDSEVPSQGGVLCGLTLVGVATPAAAPRPITTGRYVTDERDRIISLVSSAAVSNAKNSGGILGVLSLRHDFASWYLRGDATGPRIVINVNAAFANMLPCKPGITSVRIGATDRFSPIGASPVAPLKILAWVWTNREEQVGYSSRSTSMTVPPISLLDPDLPCSLVGGEEWTNQTYAVSSFDSTLNLVVRRSIDDDLVEIEYVGVAPSRRDDTSVMLLAGGALIPVDEEGLWHGWNMWPTHVHVVEVFNPSTETMRLLVSQQARGGGSDYWWGSVASVDGCLTGESEDLWHHLFWGGLPNFSRTTDIGPGRHQVRLYISERVSGSSDWSDNGEIATTIRVEVLSE